MSTSDLLERQREQLQAEIRQIEKEIKSAPEGLLMCYKKGNANKWYHETITTEGKRKRTYIPKKDEAFAQKLALKTYYNHALIEKKNELANIEKYLKRAKPIISDKFLESSSGYYSLLKGQFGLEEWESTQYDRSTSHPESLTIMTRKGDYVRSKSEAFIADTLYELHIPYRYECAVQINDITIYPDFTILHPKTKKIFLWEHFGLMDNPSYVRNSLSKIPLYISKSYMPGNNLIITYESQAMPISFAMIREIINLYFG
jgi:hypothetical protein